MGEAEKLAKECWELEEEMVPALELILKNAERIEKIQVQEFPRLGRTRFKPFEGNPFARLGQALEAIKAHHKRYKETLALAGK